MSWIVIVLSTLLLPAQVPLENVEKDEYPAHDDTETAEEAVIASFFEETNVGNLHLFPSANAKASYDYFFKGKELPDNVSGLIDPDWRADMPEGMKAYAVYTIKGAPDPFYIIRFEGEGVRNTIELFEMEEGMMEHRQTLAMYWCKPNECIQQDAWLQDADGDTLFDLIKRVKIWDSEKNRKVIGEYHTVMTQLDDGTFVQTGNIPIDLMEYPMEELSDSTQ